jgi:predicted MarR family transcription regulator
MQQRKSKTNASNRLRISGLPPRGVPTSGVPTSTLPTSEIPFRILSSAHLAAGAVPELSELEFGLIVANNSFSRWVVRCMSAAGAPDLTHIDIMLLHHAHHRDRKKKLADLSFTLNYEDTHVVSYSLKKMLAQGLLASEKIGKEVYYSTTADGAHLVERYRKVRDQCLLPAVQSEIADTQPLAQVAQVLRMLSGLYDQAARGAASL